MPKLLTREVPSTSEIYPILLQPVVFLTLECDIMSRPGDITDVPLMNNGILGVIVEIGTRSQRSSLLSLDLGKEKKKKERKMLIY